MEEISILPGRVRLKSPQFFDKITAQYLNISIEKLTGIKYSKTNFYTSSILVVYDMEKINKEEIKENIKRILENIKTDGKIDLTSREAYLEAIENQNKAKNRFLFYGGLYLIFRLKNSIFGVFSIGRNIRLLVTASVITMVEGYPIFKRLTKHLSTKSSRLSDMLLRIIAISLIFLREDATGCLLLSLKYINDYLKESTKVEYLRILHQSISENSGVVRLQDLGGRELLSPIDSLKIGDIIYVNEGEVIPADGGILQGEATIDGIYSNGQINILHMLPNQRVYEGMKLLSGNITVEVSALPHSREKIYKAVEELHIYQKINSYQEGIGGVSIIAASLNYLITGSLMNALGIILLLCPTASELALTTGTNSYLHLLGKHKIFLKNPSGLEKAAYINHIAFDKTGTLTYRKTEVTDSAENEGFEEGIRRDAYTAIEGLKRGGISNFSLLTGDTSKQAQKIAIELGIENIYSDCSREEKGKILQRIKERDHVMMVGDGVNDLEAMYYADISVGLLHSSCDKVKRYSDCVIFEDDLNKLVDFITLSQKSYRAINQHINFSKYYNISLGILALFVPFSPYTAKYLNTINSLLVLLSSKRIQYLQPNLSICLTDSGINPLSRSI